MTDRLSSAMDWEQVRLNGGPPCFKREGARLCGRAERWQGHAVHGDHRYVSLEDWTWETYQAGVRDGLRDFRTLLVSGYGFALDGTAIRELDRILVTDEWPVYPRAAAPASEENRPEADSLRGDDERTSELTKPGRAAASQAASTALPPATFDRATLVERAKNSQWHDDNDTRSFSELMADFALTLLRERAPEADCPPHNKLLTSEQWQAAVNQRDASLSRLMDETAALRAEVERLERQLKEAQWDREAAISMQRQREDTIEALRGEVDAPEALGREAFQKATGETMPGYAHGFAEAAPLHISGCATEIGQSCNCKAPPAPDWADAIALEHHIAEECRRDLAALLRSRLGPCVEALRFIANDTTPSSEMVSVAERALAALAERAEETK